MSSFALKPVTATSPTASEQQKHHDRKLFHRTSDPTFSDHDLNDAVDMGENAVWAHLEEPIYAEKDLEIFRPTQKQSTLPVYYIKGWLQFSADTVFNTLMDARYRKQWDTNVKQLYVVERKQDGEIMYFSLNLPWPFSNRDYVYFRRSKFFPKQNAFVVVCQSVHHTSAPESNGLVRVETCALRMCIRATSSETCDFHMEYEDDTNFSIPNCVINLLLHTTLPSFMTALRSACATYASYTKTLDDNSVQCIPSQVVRKKNEEESRANAVASNSDSTAPTKKSKPKRHYLTRRIIRRRYGKAHTDDEEQEEEDRLSEPTRHIDLPSRTVSSSSGGELENGSGKTRRTVKKATSMSKLFSSKISSSDLGNNRSQLMPPDDDFIIEFRKQKIGLHLETELFSNKVLVAFCEKNSEAAKSSICIEPGFLVTSVNGVSVADYNFNEILHEIKKSTRPLTLGFTHPDKEASKKYRRFKEPRNVLKCLVSRDEHDLLKALRPLDEDACISAVLKCDFHAPAFQKKKMRTVSSAALSSSATTDMVLIPEGYLVHEIDDCYVLNLPFAEIAHLLQRNGDTRVVTFKAALEVVGDRETQAATRSALSKRLSGVFQWRTRSFDEVSTPRTHSVKSHTVAQPEGVIVGSTNSERVPETIPSKQHYDLSHVSGSNGESACWGDASPGCCLSDYSGVTITAENLSWAWQHVHLLKADERVFSGALLIDKIETFLKNRCNDSLDVINKISSAMREEQGLIRKIKDRHEQGERALQEFNDEENGNWQFGQCYFGVSTHWKPGENGTVWLKMDGMVEGVDIFNTISVIRETDLFSCWAPFCNHSVLLQQTGHVDIVTYMNIAFPFLQRDAVMQAFGVNACYEHRAILLLGHSVDESTLPNSISVPKVKAWNADRAEILGFRALIEPITRTKARTCIVANIDPKCPIPKSLLNFGIKKAAGLLVYLLRKEAEKIEKAQRERTSNEHLRRIEADPSHFYAWLRPLLEKWFEDQHYDMLPAPLAFVAVEHAADVKDPSSNQKPMSFKHDQSYSSPPKSIQTNRTAPFHLQNSLLDSHQVTTENQPYGKRMWIDYLYDFGIWPYLLGLFVFGHVTPEIPFLHVCIVKFMFTCVCTWFGVPGAFKWQTRQLKRVRNELDPLRQRCLVLAAIYDVLSSWMLRIWVNWCLCYVKTFFTQGSCFEMTPLEVRESENFWLIASSFLFATIVVGVQIVVNI